MNAHDDPVDQALRAAMRRAVDDVHPTPDLDGVLAGARRADTEPADDRTSRARGPLMAVAAAAAAVATIIGIGAGADLLSPSPSSPATDVATTGPVPEDGDRVGGVVDPFAPVRVGVDDIGQPRWLVPVYRMQLGASPDGRAPRAFPLVGVLTEVASDGDRDRLLEAALTADLPAGVADYGTTVLEDLRLEDVQDESGRTVVSLVADGLSPDVPARDRVRTAALQQAAWTAQSVLGTSVTVQVELEDSDETVVVTPDPEVLDAFQIARPVIGTTIGTDEEVRLTGTTPADTTEFGYELFRSTPVPGGARLELVDSGDVAYGEVREDLAGRRSYDTTIPTPEQPGTYELSVRYVGSGGSGGQDLEHVFEVVDGSRTSGRTP